MAACLLGPAAMTATAPAAAQGMAVSGEATLASDLSERGLAIWPGYVVAQGLLAVSDGSSWAASLVLSAPVREDLGTQAITRASHYWALPGDWQAKAHLSYYAYPGSRALRAYDHTEATVGAAFRDLLSLELSASRLRERATQVDWAVDLGLRWPLGEHGSLAGGLGRADLPGWPGLRYTYADAGLVWQAGPWRATLRSLRTSGAVRELLGEAARPRASASVTYTF
jgi:hypothetical protein